MQPAAPPSPEQVFGIVGAMIFAGIVLALSLWMAWRNLDLPGFDALRKTAPSHFRNLVWVCRTNGPLVFLMSLGGVIFSPGLLFDKSMPWLAFRIVGTAIGFLYSVGWMYLSWRWTRW